MLPLNWVSSSMRDAGDDYQQTRLCQNLIAHVMLQAIVDHLSNVRRFGAEAAMGREPARWIRATKSARSDICGAVTRSIWRRTGYVP